MQNYFVVKKLGTGTYGSAYLVNLKVNPSQQYVLKKIKVDGGDVSADSEVKVLRSLSHPLVLSYIDHFMYKGHLCIVTEYCDAGDLYQLLRARKAALPEPQLLDLFAQVVLAIQHVHSKNILHRDLKTQNIFLTSGGSIRLGDFGISRPLNGTMDLASTIIGTPYYMSPEVMSSMPYDFKSDMWSLGCVLYEMMSLKHAFDATDMSSLVMKILRGEHLPIPQAFSQELKDLVRQLLCKNPKMRPSPDQILKMPFMKEYVARARETVAQLEQVRARGRGASGRRTDNGQVQAGSQPLHRQSFVSVGMGGMDVAAGQGGPCAGAGVALSPSQLNRELEAAKERLRRIQLERDALMKQKAHGGAQACPVPPNGRNSSNQGNHRYSASQQQLQAAQSPPLAGQHSESSIAVGRASGGVGACSAAAGAGLGSPGVLSPGSAAAAAAGLSGKSWREKEEALYRLQARSSRELPLLSQASSVPGAGPQPGMMGGLNGQYPHVSTPYLPHLAGDVDTALERHREQRQLRSSRPQSPDYGGGGGFGSGSPPGVAGAAALDPKTRMKARKEEEARRREAELLQARKVYFEERKQAAARLQQLYTPSPSNQVVASARRVTDSSPVHSHGDPHSVSSSQNYASPHHLRGSLGRCGLEAALARESSNLDNGGSGSASGTPGGFYYGGAGLPLRGVSGLGISDSDDDMNEAYNGHLYGDGSAMQEFESELAGGMGPGLGLGLGGAPAPGGAQPLGVAAPQLQQALDQGGLAERILALREVCAYNLGQPLYELIYGYIRKRMAQGLTDDAAFRQELLQRLGQGRMQYVHLIDQLIYFEDMHGRQSGMI